MRDDFVTKIDQPRHMTDTSVSDQSDDLVPGAIWPDTAGVHINAHGGGMLLHDGVYYWFGEHKIAGEAGNLAQVGVGCYSSRDLYQWKNEGVALPVAEDMNSPIAKSCILERPKVLFNPRTKKFVMWFHLEPPGRGYGAACSGVAISSTPTGPYQFLQALRPNAGAWPTNVPEEGRRELTDAQRAQIAKLDLKGGPVEGYPLDLIYRRDFATGQMARDMTLFADNDGYAYHIYSSEDNGTLHISLLADDCLSPAGKYVRIFPGRFNEAPAIFKARGKYWLITSGCTGWQPNAARLAMADSIWGPWKELSNPCRGKDADLTFQGQSTFVLPVQGNPDAFIFMADRWNPKNAMDGRYIWLPIQFQDGVPFVEWMDRWNLEFFKR